MPQVDEVAPAADVVPATASPDVGEASTPLDSTAEDATASPDEPGPVDGGDAVTDATPSETVQMSTDEMAAAVDAAAVVADVVTDGDEATAVRDLRIGSAGEPDRYKLYERLSRGNNGDLYRGALLIDDVEIPVALKVSWGEEGLLEAARDKWLKQAEILRSLEHPALVKVREVFEGAEPHLVGEAGAPDRVICMAMNWVEGESLDSWVKTHPDRSVGEVAFLLGPVASAIDYLHEGIAGRSVLHRNLKPANVLVTADGGMRLVGFGTARLQKLDAQMTIVGTPAWMPPEVLNGQPYDSAADRWGLGAVTYYVLVGSAPPLLNEAKARDTLLAAPILSGRADIADHVATMLANDPAVRPESATAWLQQLHALVDLAPTGSTPAPPAAPPAPTVAPSPPAGGPLPPPGAQPVPPEDQKKRRFGKG